MRGENKIMNQQPTSSALHAETCCASSCECDPCKSYRKYLEWTRKENQSRNTMNITREELEKLIQEVVKETSSNACQAIRYAVKHQDFTDSHPEYRMGWIVGSKVCEEAIRPHIERKQADVAAIVEGFCKDHSLHNVSAHTQKERVRRSENTENK